MTDKEKDIIENVKAIAYLMACAAGPVPEEVINRTGDIIYELLEDL